MKIGLIVNPIAGMGGKVGLKGTDGVAQEAIARGAKPVAPKRAVEFLQKLKENAERIKIELTTCPGVMGENEAETANLFAKILPMTIESETTAKDTRTAVRLLIVADVDLIVFVGGDGTARDIFDAIQTSGKLPVLGVPAGVKMYSGVFAVNVNDAVEVALAFAQKRAETAELEVMDADEEAIRRGSLAVKLYGYIEGPFLPAHIQGSKQLSPETTDERENQTAAARFVIEEMRPDETYVLGPGTTIKRMAELLGIEKTLLGVDIYRNGRVTLDVDDKIILTEVHDWRKTWIVVSPIGRQGILLGRGNQQISPEVVKRVGKERIIVIATKNKLQSIEGNVLRVDTGDPEADNMLKGYIRVVTDYKEWRLMTVQ
jgi:predicted polyphosphate/ATP-dependent NAD kinase